MPGGMFKWCIEVGPASGIIHQDHKCYSSAPENIKRIEAFLQGVTFNRKDKEPGNSKQDIAVKTGYSLAVKGMRFSASDDP
jgi:hypothetical protein